MNYSCKQAQLSVIGVFLLCSMSQGVFAQADSSAAVRLESSNLLAKMATVDADSVADRAGAEMVLDEILIEAVIEKPNVAILPGREIAGFDEIEFINRSFEEELRQVPRELVILGGENESEKSIRRLRQIISQQRKNK